MRQFFTSLKAKISLDKHFCFRFGTIAKRLSKEEIKKQLLESMITDEVAEFADLNKEAKEI